MILQCHSRLCLQLLTYTHISYNYVLTAVGYLHKVLSAQMLPSLLQSWASVVAIRVARMIKLSMLRLENLGHYVCLFWPHIFRPDMEFCSIPRRGNKTFTFAKVRTGSWASPAAGSLETWRTFLWGLNRIGREPDQLFLSSVEVRNV
jgi:hypothetical protein